MPHLPDSPTLAVFAGASLLLAVVPGPAVFYIVARSIDQGRMAGFVSALGISVGGLVHVTATTLGVAALVMSSAIAFSVLKYAGAAYLVYVGLRRIRSGERPAAPDVVLRAPHSRIFWQGVVVNVLNPKTALFFLAFLPQFVSPGHGPVSGQIALLGLLFVSIALASDASYALAAGWVARRVRGHGGFLRAQRWVTGGTFVALGVTAALASRK